MCTVQCAHCALLPARSQRYFLVRVASTFRVHDSRCNRRTPHTALLCCSRVVCINLDSTAARSANAGATQIRYLLDTIREFARNRGYCYGIFRSGVCVRVRSHGRWRCQLLGSLPSESQGEDIEWDATHMGLNEFLIWRSRSCHFCHTHTHTLTRTHAYETTKVLYFLKNKFVTY